MKSLRLLWSCLLLTATAVLAEQGSPAASAAIPPGSSMEGQASLGSKIDAIFREWTTATTPGAAVAVIRQGKVVLEQGYGIANLEYGVPIRPETVFHVASVSKQFTAMAVVLLEADGRLSLDDDVHRYLPELPDYGHPITLRDLLQHTSGLRDQWMTLTMAGWNMQDVITQDQILRLLFRQKELNFPPGTRYVYSNSGFTLLAEIVARVSGRPFPQFCAERIFTPLGMNHTHFHQDLTQLVPGRAYSYASKGAGFAAAPLNYANVGATSLFTTADDLVKWLDNFRDPKVGGPAGIARLQVPCVLSDGTKPGYGLGLSLGIHRGLPTLSHGGGDAGYRSFVLWFPKQQLGVVVLSNLGSFDAARAANAVADAALGDLPGPDPAAKEEPRPAFATTAPKDLGRYAGIYVFPKIAETTPLLVQDGKLWAAGNRPPAELRPLVNGHFYINEIKAEIEFTPKPDGGMIEKITQPGSVNEGDRVSPAEAKIETDLRPYTGVYWSEELETQYTICLRDGALIGMHSHHGEFRLSPLMRDRFSTTLKFGAVLRFMRDARGQVTGLKMSGDRVTGVDFGRRPGGVLELKPLRPMKGLLPNP